MMKNKAIGDNKSHQDQQEFAQNFYISFRRMALKEIQKLGGDKFHEQSSSARMFVLGKGQALHTVREAPFQMTEIHNVHSTTAKARFFFVIPAETGI
jgi:hypothetical protein